MRYCGILALLIYCVVVVRAEGIDTRNGNALPALTQQDIHQLTSDAARLPAKLAEITGFQQNLVTITPDLTTEKLATLRSLSIAPLVTTRDISVEMLTAKSASLTTSCLLPQLEGKHAFTAMIGFKSSSAALLTELTPLPARSVDLVTPSMALGKFNLLRDMPAITPKDILK